MYAAPIRLTRQQLLRDIPILPRDAYYMGSDRTGHYFIHKSDAQLGDIGDMFKRMFKFTSKSFTPANISRSIWRLTPASVALQLVAPKIEKTIYKDVVPIALPVAAGIAAAAAFGPQIWSVVGPKLSAAASYIGSNAGTIGGALVKVMGSLSPGAQSQVAQQITPEQIAQVEQNGALTPDVMRLIEQAQSNNPGMLPTSIYGAADAYPTGGLPPPIKAGMDTPMMLAMMGGLTVIALTMGKK